MYMVDSTIMHCRVGCMWWVTFICNVHLSDMAAVTLASEECLKRSFVYNTFQDSHDLRRATVPTARKEYIRTVFKVHIDASVHMKIVHVNK